MIANEALAVEFEDLAEAVAQGQPGELLAWLDMVKAGLTGWEALDALAPVFGRVV